MLLFTERANFLYNDELRLQFDKPVEQVGIAWVNKGKLRNPLFLQLQSKDQAKGAGEVFQVKGTWYETVETLERLQQLTAVSYKEELTLTWQYRSLRQEAFQDTLLRVTLPKTQAYYVKIENLHKDDPRPRSILKQEDRGSYYASPKYAGDLQYSPEELINALQGKEPPVLKGVESLNALNSTYRISDLIIPQPI